MDIAISGPRNGKLQEDLVLQTYAAVKGFAKYLGINRLKTTIHVKLHHSALVDGQDAEALCEAIDERHFRIDIGLYSNWLSNLAHEMVHVKQFAMGELDPGLTRWKSNRYAGNIEYWDQPWEKEARKLQYIMAELHTKGELL